MLHTDHVEGGKTLDILVLLLIGRGSMFGTLQFLDFFKNRLLHSVEGTDCMTPDGVLLGL